MKRQLGLAYLALKAPIKRRFGSFPKPGAFAEQPTAIRPRILVVSPYSIHPLIHGGAVRIFNLTRRLSRHAEVSILIFGGGSDDPPQRAALESFCHRVFFQKYPRAECAPDPWHLLPPSAGQYASPVVAERISAIVDAHGIDVVVLEYTEMGQFAGPYPGAGVVLVEHDLSFRSHARQRSVGIDKKYAADKVLGRGFGDWLRRYDYELDVCGEADQIHVMSAADHHTLASLLPDGDSRIRIISNGVDTDHFRPPQGDTRRQGALFVGSFPHLPNRDAFDVLVNDVWPLVRDRLPEAQLTVAGARPPQAVLNMDGCDGITVAGEVPDLAPLYQAHRALAVPIRAGSGTRLKILEAMACGLPVVSTTIGAEGIDYRPDHDLLVADEPADMAEALVRLLEGDAEKVDSLSMNGRRLVTDLYDWDHIAKELRNAITEVLPSPPPPNGTADSNGQPDGTPSASVILQIRGGGAALERCLAGLAGQRTERRFEIVAVTSGGSPADLQILSRHGARVVSHVLPPGDSRSPANTGARAARGKVLVFLDENATPADDLWLDRLLAPFDADRPPAAVQGGLNVQFEPGGLPYDPTFTAETRRWRTRMGGFAFSMANAAIHSAAWERFPFSGDAPVDRRWQRQAEANDLLILPCWDAAVHWIRPMAPKAALGAAFDEGRAWKDLGVRYRLIDLFGDLFGLDDRGDQTGEAAAPPAGMTTRTHRMYRVVRPIGLFLGNRSRRG